MITNYYEYNIVICKCQALLYIIALENLKNKYNCTGNYPLTNK